MSRFAIRIADADDAPALAALLAEAFADASACYPEPRPPSADDLAVRMQTGEAFLLAELAGEIAGVLRWQRDEDGIAGFDLLASRVAGAGRALIRAVEARAQDGGLRLVRAELPDEPRLAGYFAALGYLPIGRAIADFRDESVPILTVERRLPLLTVREQRRGDAAAIAALAGEDPWPFEQGARPGWFVASDGDRVVGVIQSRDAAGVAAIREPVLAAGYEGRGARRVDGRARRGLRRDARLTHGRTATDRAHDHAPRSPREAWLGSRPGPRQLRETARRRRERGRILS